MNEPWMKFFPGDHFRDPGVRSVSLAARGLWIDMLCLMHQSARKGYLQHPSGLPITPAQLARMAGGGVDEVAGLLQELEDSGVFSRTKDGVIYSRRMDRDARKSALCSEAGRRGGGNPRAKHPPLNVTFKGEPKGDAKGELKVISHSEVRGQMSEVRSQKEEEGKPSLPPEGGGGGADEGQNPAGEARAELQQIVQLFHQHCPAMPRVQKVEGTRLKSVRARWKAAVPDSLAWFENLFRMAGESRKIKEGNWCGFDWLMSPSNSQKVLEGNYADKKVQRDPVTGRALR